jgi:hypothetical protein
MKFCSLPIAPSVFTLLVGLTTVGCSQTAVPNTAEKPITNSPSNTPASNTPASVPANSAPSPIEAPESKPVPARSLTTPEKPLKDKKLDESSGEQKNSQKPIANRALLFSCLTENNKEILLYQTDETIDYSFGDFDAKPELDLKVPRDQASTWQWKGVGRAMTYAVDVPNGDTSYSVFWSVDRLSPTKEIEAGVRVHRDRKTLATVYCTRKIVNNLQGVQLKPTEY